MVTRMTAREGAEGRGNRSTWGGVAGRGRQVGGRRRRRVSSRGVCAEWTHRCGVWERVGEDTKVDAARVGVGEGDVHPAEEVAAAATGRSSARFPPMNDDEGRWRTRTRSSLTI